MEYRLTFRINAEHEAEIVKVLNKKKEWSIFEFDKIEELGN